ncbi:MAG: EAL domain-containing protein [Campylobacterota bacterium]|nr:EAL domain-containing protein [Campylobacterota bacterium]
MALNEKSILKIIATAPLVFIPLVIIITALLVINIYNDSLQKAIVKLETNLIQTEKKAIQSKVDSIADLIVYQKSIVKEDLTSRLKQRVENVIYTAETIYQQYKDTKLPDEIKNIITTTLRTLQWNNSESYIWIVDYNGVLQLGPDNLRHLEGTSILDFKDASGQEIIKEEIALCKKDGEGYLWDSFSKPSKDLSEQFEQFAFVKALGHYDWYLGTAEFLDTAIKTRDDRLLKSIEKLGGTSSNYIFIINTKGDMLLNPSTPEMVGKNIFKFNSPSLKNVLHKIKDALQDKSQAFLSYPWINPETQQEETKYTYVHTIADSEWIVGSGFYSSTIKNTVAKQTVLMHEDYYSKFKYLIFISLIILIFGLILSYFLSQYLKNSFLTYRHKINKATKDLQKLNSNLEDKIQDRTKELEEMTGELQILAYHDALTGLPNRVLLADRLKQAIKKAKRHNTGLALFFIDLDKFKEVNDSFGHELGDSVLKTVAESLNGIIRKEDTLARLGGDEFTIIMEELTRPQDALLMAEKILKVMKKPVRIDGLTLYISCSIGISLYNKTVKDANDFLKYADTAMYRAKEKGRDNFQFYSSEMTELAYKHMTMKTSLRQAINNEEFVIYYQPQIDGLSNKLVGVEALIRWEHPTMGLLPPKDFIPLAEETGMIVEIDQWVIKTAMNQVSLWYQEGLIPGVLALNISIPRLESNDFLQGLKEQMNKHSFKSEWLELEVTEGQMIKEPERVIKKLDQVSDLGINISIDDFGTGYSSLSLLKRLPIHRLKIDRSFVKDVPRDTESVAIIKAIIALAKSLNLDLIAEGAETSVQKDFLIDNGCTTIQGFYYTPPVPTEEMHILLLQERWK